MSDIQEVRRANLRRLVADNEGMNNLARRLGLTKGAYISQMLVTPPVRPISEKTARKWEKALSLQPGFFDRAVSPYASTLTGSPAAAPVDTSTLARVVTYVVEALEVKTPIAPPALGELVALQYKDACAMGVDRDRIRAFVSLLKR